jgi:CheY-like chemotaxis protein
MPRIEGPLVGCRILLVEDEYLIAQLMEDWLSQAGAIVVGAVPSIEQALAYATPATESLNKMG